MINLLNLYPQISCLLKTAYLSAPVYGLLLLSFTLLFIVGHNTFVKDYLTYTRFEEEKIVAITCDGTIHFSNLRLPNKTIYISHQNDHNYADLLNGALYEFDFDPTESEILLYNANKLLSPLQRIEKSFHKL